MHHLILDDWLLCVYLITDLCLFANNEEFHYHKRLSLFFLTCWWHWILVVPHHFYFFICWCHWILDRNYFIYEHLGSITNKYTNLWKLLTLIAKFQLCCGPWSIFPAFFLFGVAFLHHWNFRIANKIWMKANCYFISDAW